MHLQSKHVVWRYKMRSLQVARSLGPGERGELPQRRGERMSARYRRVLRQALDLSKSETPKNVFQ
jgi:hypothetical protein